MLFPRLRPCSTCTQHYSTQACALQPTDLLARYKALVLQGKLRQDEDQLRIILQVKNLDVLPAFRLV